MATAENAKLEYEAGQQAFPMAALTANAARQVFSSAASLWSGKSGFAPVIRPDGLATGGAVTPSAALTNNIVDVAALTCFLSGLLNAVAAGPVTITRPAGAVSKVNSVTVTSAGVLAAVAGADGPTTAFTETRGAPGGPPFIPVGSIEVAQVRLISSAAAPITSAQVFAVIGQHTEMSSTPLWNVSFETGRITFLSPLPPIHTGGLPKGVFASFSSPIFSDVALASDFTAPETTHSVSSTQIYGTTLGSSSQALGQGAFTAYLDDGVSDALIAQKNQTLWFRFYPDRFKGSYLLTQGKLGVARTFPAGNSVQAACTISASNAATEVVA